MKNGKTALSSIALSDSILEKNRHRFLLLFLILSLFATREGRAETFSLPLFSLEKPTYAPAFVFEDGTGKQHRLTDFKGRFIVLHFWATWCPACVHELPSLDALPRLLNPQKFVVLAISEDIDPSVIRAFYQQKGIANLELFRDPSGRAASAFELSTLPATVFINPTGQRVGLIENDVDWRAQEVVDGINNLLK